MEITIEEIQKKFDGLPEDIKWVIMEADVENKILEIGKKEGLTVNQMGQLALETNTMIFGFYPPEKFEDSLKVSMQLPDDKIRAIVGDVNDTILKTIREKMKESRTETATEIEIPDNTPSNLNNQTTSDDTEIFKSAGIEIVTPKEETKIKIEIPTEKREDILAKVERPELINKEIEPAKIPPSIHLSKLSGSFQIPSKKTEYSLQNISKTGLPTNTQPISMPVPTTVSKSIKGDPYREPTE